MAIDFKNLFTNIKKQVNGLVPATFIKKSNGNISDNSRSYTTTDLTEIKTMSRSQKDTIKAIIQNSPDASMAVSTMARFAITDEYKVAAYTLDGRIDVAATEAAHALVNRLDRLRPTYKHYTMPSDFRSLSERALKQLPVHGSFGAELVLGPGQAPSHISIFSTGKMKYEEKGGRAIPYIEKDSVKYYIDSPLAVIEDLDQDVDTPYSESPMMSATQPVLADFEFVNDLRRAFSKASLPRPTAEINEERFLASLPPDVRYDGGKLKAAMQAAVDGIREEMNGLRPEDALVHFDSIVVKHLSAGNISAHDNVRAHKEILDAKISSGLHTLPSILGRGSNSTVASTEAMAYLRAVEGVQEKLNHMYSSLLTVGLRLYGFDVFVNFAYSDPELRPRSELEAFRSMKQARVLQLLSYGFKSDEEASILLTGALPSGNFTPLSGTRFLDSIDTDLDNPYSNTSVTPDGVNDTKSGKDQKADNQKPSSNKTSGK